MEEEARQILPQHTNILSELMPHSRCFRNILQDNASLLTVKLLKYTPHL
jgi:hypothetical protein